MATCVWTEECVFFSEEVGFSPDLNAAMRQRFCLGDNTGCARLEALAVLPLDEIPDDLLPTDNERLQRLVEERTGG